MRIKVVCILKVQYVALFSDNQLILLILLSTRVWSFLICSCWTENRLQHLIWPPNQWTLKSLLEPCTYRLDCFQPVDGQSCLSSIPTSSFMVRVIVPKNFRWWPFGDFWWINTNTELSHTVPLNVLHILFLRHLSHIDHTRTCDNSGLTKLSSMFHPCWRFSALMHQYFPVFSSDQHGWCFMKSILWMLVRFLCCIAMTDSGSMDPVLASQC